MGRAGQGRGQREGIPACLWHTQTGECGAGCWEASGGMPVTAQVGKLRPTGPWTAATHRFPGSEAEPHHGGFQFPRSGGPQGDCGSQSLCTLPTQRHLLKFRTNPQSPPALKPPPAERCPSACLHAGTLQTVRPPWPPVWARRSQEAKTQPW